MTWILQADPLALRMAALTLPFVLVLASPAWTQEANPGEVPVRDSIEIDDLTQDPEPLVPSALAQFTTAVEDREPIDQLTFVSNEVESITFFSDLRGLEGQTVTHRWVYDGKTMAEVAFEVRGPRWRVWSSKELTKEWTGDWTVEIVDGDGEVIAAETFTYSAPGA